MESPWVKVFDTADLIQAEMMLNLLQTHQIECVLMNKRSSIFLIRLIEIWVIKEQETNSLILISNEFEDKYPNNQN